MSTAQQQRRESMDIGETVDVITTYGNGRQETVRAARVIEVLRAAARLRFNDGAERMIPFKNIRQRASVQAPPAVVIPKPPPEPIVPPPAPPAPKVESAPVPKSTLTDVQTWLSMGKDFLKPMDDERADLCLEGAGLEAEKAAIEARLDEIAERLRVLHTYREQVSKLVGAGLPDKKAGR